jgi:hypothetical protein
MEFRLIKYTDLNRKHFEESLTWAQYYSPEDIDTLEKLGFDREVVSSCIEKTGWSDDYWFAVPEETEIGSFMFEKRKADFMTPCGKHLTGFVVNSGHCVCLFGATKDWYINLNLLDWLKDQITELRADVGLAEHEQLLPLNVTIRGSGFQCVIARG